MKSDQTIERLRIVGVEAAIAFLNEMIRRLNPEGIDRYNKGGRSAKFITCINPWKKEIYNVPLSSFDFKTFDWGNIFDELTLCQLRAFGLLSQDDHQVIMIHGNGNPQIYAGRPRPQSEMPEFPDYAYDSSFVWSIIANVFSYQESPGTTHIIPEQSSTSAQFGDISLSFSSGAEAIWVMTVVLWLKDSNSDRILNIVHRESTQNHTNGFYHAL